MVEVTDETVKSPPLSEKTGEGKPLVEWLRTHKGDLGEVAAELLVGATFVQVVIPGNTTEAELAKGITTLLVTGTLHVGWNKTSEALGNLQRQIGEGIKLKIEEKVRELPGQRELRELWEEEREKAENLERLRNGLVETTKMTFTLWSHRTGESLYNMADILEDVMTNDSLKERYLSKFDTATSSEMLINDPLPDFRKHTPKWLERNVEKFVSKLPGQNDLRRDVSEMQDRSIANLAEIQATKGRLKVLVVLSSEFTGQNIGDVLREVTTIFPQKDEKTGKVLVTKREANNVHEEMTRRYNALYELYLRDSKHRSKTFDIPSPHS